MSTEPIYTEKKKASISAIWIVPIIAIIMGGFLIFKEWQNRGVPITVEFISASGLAAEKSELRYRDVKIGTVDSIIFSKDQKKVMVEISVNRENKELLRKGSQFWVVKPRFSRQGVSGFDTLLTGSYVQLEPSLNEEEAHEFVGLEVPPITPANEAGLHLTLKALDGNDISVGDAVIYRGFVVGKVEQVSFSVKDRNVQYHLFISAPYDELVTSNTVFWQANGINLRQTGNGLELEIASVQTLLSGGIEFDVPEGQSVGYKVEDYTTFQLYANESDYIDSHDYESIEYLMLVDDSIRGLRDGAPVEFRGYRVGTVHVPELNFSPVSGDANGGLNSRKNTYLVVKLEPGRILENYDLKQFKNTMDLEILDGLSASIESLNVITGSKMINLDYSDTEVVSIEHYGDYDVIPIQPGKVNGIVDSANGILSMLNELPLQNTIVELNSALASLNDLLKSADTVLDDGEMASLASNVNSSMAALNTLLGGLNEGNTGQNVGEALNELKNTLQGFEPGSPLYNDLGNAIAQLSEMLDNLSPFVSQLSRTPDMLIFGKDGAPDIQPKARVRQYNN